MPQFAEIDKNGVVLRVIVADQAFIDSGAVGNPSAWKETKEDGSLRKNYAGPGATYDKGLDAFVPPKPFASFVLNAQTAKYEAPVAKPVDGKSYDWDEKSLNWIPTSEVAVADVSVDTIKP